MKPSERIRELAEAGETHPFLIGNQARLDAIVAYLDERHAAAVPAGNQAKAPTALDETRAVQEATRSNACERGRCTPELTEMCGKHQDDYEASCVRNNLADGGTTSGYNPGAVAEKNPVIAAIDDYIEGLRAQLAESREALARVEAERDECQARNNELIDAFRRADAESRELRRKFDSTHKLARDFGRHIDAVECENTKLHAVIEAARATLSYLHPQGVYGRTLAAALAALDQVASGPECAQKGHAYATNKGECCIYCFRPKAECLHMGEPASEAEVTPAVCGKWITDAFLQDCGLPHGHSGACQSRASDPEATESATKETT